MFKFNNGNGAIICDICRIIIKEPSTQEEAEKSKNENGLNLCLKHKNNIKIKQ